MNKLLVICGPTATGKTALAADIAKKFNGELISADSRQVYRGMDLVTGKDRPAGATIWLYDLIDPDEPFSVSQWVSSARAAVVDILKRGKLPIVVGGTGLYIRALLHPFETIDIPPDTELRSRLQSRTVRELQQLVPRKDMNDSDWNNPRRLIRKIETANAGKKRPARIAQDVLVIGLTAPTELLSKRIDERMRDRKQKGLESEAAALTLRYGRDIPAMTAIGVNEYAYAKRQLTWFRKQRGIRWFDISERDYRKQIESAVRAWYN